MEILRFPNNLLHSIRLRLADISITFGLFVAAGIVVSLYLAIVYQQNFRSSYSIKQFVFFYSILYGVVVALAYGIFRIGMGRFLSMGC